MKKNELLLLAAFVFIVGTLVYVFINFNERHTKTSISDYQLNVTQDSIILIDQGRHVGSLTWEQANKIDSLIINDNQ